MEPKVSIILLSFNQVDHINEAVKSVFDQTYKNWELILSDNGSEDGTKEILKSYDNDKRVKLLQYDTNDYVTKRSNQALKEVSGEFISFLYGDDCYLPNKIEEQIKCFEKLSTHWGVVHSPGYSLDEFTKIKTLDRESAVHGEALKEILENFFSKGFINPISPLIRKECFEKYPFYEDLFTEGESIFFKFSLSYKFFYLDTPLVIMRAHDKNARWYSKRNIEILDKCLERLRDYEEFPKHCSDSLSRLRSQNYSFGAWDNLRLSENVDIEYIRNRIYKAFSQDAIKTISAKNFLVLALTLFPDFVIKIFNFIVDSVLGKKKSIYFDESFVKKNQD